MLNDKAVKNQERKQHRGRRWPGRMRGAIMPSLNFFGYFLFSRKESNKHFSSKSFDYGLLIF
jgi:hypothetical protein